MHKNNSHQTPKKSDGAADSGMVKDWVSTWLDVFKNPTPTQDILAGFTVAAVAVPLNIALAVVCGLPPITGLIAGAIGGLVAGIFGGAPFQVTGPAAALNVMVLALTVNYGPVGVAAACLIIGLIQIGLMALSAGKLVRYVPEALLAGFTTGVGIKILDNQIPEFLGFDYRMFEIAAMVHRPEWLHEVSWLAAVCGLFVAFFVVSFKEFKRFPAALVAIMLITAVSVHLQWPLQRVGEVPSSIPGIAFPNLDSSKWFSLFIATIPLALLAAIESLLSAQAIDRLTNSKKPHNSNLELMGQGLANIATGFFGGMPVSGVIVRSSVNVQSGAKTRLSSILHAVILLTAIVYLSHLMELIPLSALAGLLCIVGWRLIEFKTLIHLARENRLEAAAFVLAATGTVTGHLFLGLITGGFCCFIAYKLEQSKRASESKNKKKDIADRPAHIRASIRAGGTSGQTRPVHYEPNSGGANWLLQIKEKAQVAASSFIHQKASVIGRVVLGEHVHIAAEASVRADEGSPFFIGSNSNIQDGVVIHALKEKWVTVGATDWAVYIGENVSAAHQALIHGPCYIGDNSFIGFKAVVHDSVVGSHCYIGIGAVVVGVEIPSHRYVPHGMIVDSMDKVDALPPVSDQHLEFNEDVVHVNKGLAAAYKKNVIESPSTRLARMNTSVRRRESDRF